MTTLLSGRYYSVTLLSLLSTSDTGNIDTLDVKLFTDIYQRHHDLIHVFAELDTRCFSHSRYHVYSSCSELVTSD